MGRYQKYPEYIYSGLAWLGDMPSHWELRKSKYLFNRMQRPVRPEDGVITAFRDGQVTLRTKRRTDGFTQSVKEIGYQSVRTGDLLVHAMDGFAGAIGVSDSDGKCSPVCSVCIPVNPGQLHMPFYGYLVRQLAVTDFISSLAKGIRERSTEFRYSEFSTLDLAVPPPDEQQKIANFLDHETAKIDTLIEKQQQLIKLLKEKRQAVISHAVTKGLNPNAPMRDSGVEWLGEVPEHWVVAKFKYLVSESAAGPYGSSLTKSMYTSSGIRVYGQQQVIPDDFSIGDYYIHEKKFEEMRRYEVFPNDVLISVMGTVGKVAVAPENIERGIINPRLVKYKIMEDKVLPRFIKASILSDVSQSQLLFAAQGSTMDGLNMQIIGELPVPLPPTLAEQEGILNEVKRQGDKFDNLLRKSQVTVELLSERRTALISAAVTGKIDVRNWQAPEPSNKNNKEVAA